MSERQNYEGMLPDQVKDLEYVPLVWKKFQKNGELLGTRFEIFANFRIGKFMLQWQKCQRDEPDEKNYRQVQTIVNWLDADTFLGWLAQIERKKNAPIVRIEQDSKGNQSNVYIAEDFMGTPPKNGKPAQARQFQITDAKKDNYMYVLRGRNAEGVQMKNSTIKKKDGAVWQQIIIPITVNEFFAMEQACKRHYYAFTAAQWAMPVIRNEVQNGLAEYSKYALNIQSAVQDTDEVPDDDIPEAVEQPTVEAAPVKAEASTQPATAEPQVVADEGVVIDVADLPY